MGSQSNYSILLLLMSKELWFQMTVNKFLSLLNILCLWMSDIRVVVEVYDVPLRIKWNDHEINIKKKVFRKYLSICFALRLEGKLRKLKSKQIQWVPWSTETHESNLVSDRGMTTYTSDLRSSDNFTGWDVQLTSGLWVETDWRRNQGQIHSALYRILNHLWYFLSDMSVCVCTHILTHGGCMMYEVEDWKENNGRIDTSEMLLDAV